MFSCFWARPAPPTFVERMMKSTTTVAYMILGMALCWELAYKKDMIKNDINVNKHYPINICKMFVKIVENRTLKHIPISTWLFSSKTTLTPDWHHEISHP